MLLDPPNIRWKALLVIAVAITYFFAHQVAFYFPDSAKVLMVVWPAGGIGLAALLSCRRRLWPVLLAAMFIAGNAANLIDGRSLPASLGFMTANVLESLLCALFITRFGGSKVTLDRLREVVALLAAATVVNALTSLLGAGTAALISGKPFWKLYCSWWIADGLGILLITPFIMTWLGVRFKLRQLKLASMVESLACIVAVAIIASLAFHLRYSSESYIRPYMLLVLLVWPALRLSQRDTVLAVAVITLLGALSYDMSYGPSPFGGINHAERLLQVQAFMGIAAAMGMLLSASRFETALTLRELQKFSHIFQKAGWGMVISDPATLQILAANPAYAAMHGYSVAQIQTMNLEDVFAAESRPSLPGLAAEAEAKGHIVYESLHQRKDGTVFACETSVSAFTDASGRVLFRAATVEDISARKRVEAVLRDRELQLASAAKIAKLGPWELDIARSEFTFTDAFYDVYRTTAEREGGYSMPLDVYAARFVHPDDAAMVASETQKAIDTADRLFGQAVEHRIHYADGQTGWVSVQYFVVKDSHGHTVKTYGVNQDITERKLTEQALRESEERWQYALEGAGDGVWDWNIPAGEVAFSKRWKTMLGYEEYEIGNRFEDWSSRVHPEDLPAALTAIDDCFTGKTEQYMLEHRMLCKDGGYKWILARAKIVSRTPQGQPLRMVGTLTDLTERKLAEAAIRETEERYRSLFEQMINGYAYCKMEYGEDGQPEDFTYLVVNKAFGELTGLADVVGKRVTEVIPGIRESDAELIEIYGRVANGGDPETFEFFVHPLDMWFSVAVFSPQHGYFVAVFEVITERRRMEAELRAVNERLELSQSVTGIGVWDWDISSGRIEWSSKMFDLFGLDAAVHQASFETWRSALHPDDLEVSEQRLNFALEHHTDLASDYRIRTRAGEERWITALGKAFYLDDKPLRMLGVCIDVTARKQAETALRESEEKFRQLFSEMLDGSCLNELIRDSAGNAVDYVTLDVNTAFENLMGIQRDLVIGHRASEFMQPDELQQWVELFADIVTKGQSKRYELYSAANGRHFEGNAYPLGGSKFAVSFSDATVRINALEALRESEQRYRTVVTTTTDGIWIVSRDTVILDVNEAYSKLTGFAREEIIGKRITDFELNENLAAVQQRNRRLMKVGHDLFETRHRTKSGGYVDLEVSVTYSPGVRGEFFGFIRDITQRKRIEQQVRQSQKIEALGTLAGGIAHDFNNLLFQILGNGELLSEGIPENSPAREHLEQMMHAGRRAKDLVQQILTFSRKSEAMYQPLDLSTVMAESLKLLRGAIPRSIEMRQIFEVLDKAVVGDPTEVHQVIMNLAVNAAQAMEPEPGLLTFTLRQIELGPEALPGVELQSGTFIQLMVSDTGRGIPPEVLPFVFDPYFTTKDMDKGTGLGLSVVHGIVTRMGGHVMVESTLGKGTNFTILLPGVDPEPSKENAQAKALPLIQAHVLVVDDEPENQRIMHQLLAKLGCEVTCASSALEAWELIQTSPKRFQVLITDHSMPKVKGLQLARMLKEAKLGLPVIVYSGYGENLEPADLADAGVRLGLGKPLSALQLSAAILEALRY